ncbi:MAG: GNAT family N-acetyltransferase [Caldilineaceae bacterium]
MPTRIDLERPDTPDALQLIGELEAYLSPQYPPESRHGFSPEKLIRQNVAFFVIRQDGVPAGCGGIKIYAEARPSYGEVKRMYVRPQFRGLGLAKTMLNHLADYTQSQGVSLLRLETGIHQIEACSLYERFGFQRIAPFGEYKEDPLSIFYEKAIGE